MKAEAEVVKSHSIIDGKLIIHYGLPHINQTRFIVIDKSLAKSLHSIIQSYVREDI